MERCTKGQKGGGLLPGTIGNNLDNLPLGSSSSVAMCMDLVSHEGVLRDQCLRSLIVDGKS